MGRGKFVIIFIIVSFALYFIIKINNKWIWAALIAFVIIFSFAKFIKYIASLEDE